MNKNPYSVLGVSENASDEEIKKAYRDLVKKYHPDKYSDSDLADLANEKMQEVNAAYEQIENMRKGSSSQGYGYTGNSSYNTNNTGYATIINCINTRNFQEAYRLLNNIALHDRGAAWNYYMGLTLCGMGRIFDGRTHLERACSMDPTNLEYRAARDRFAGVGYNYSGNMGTPRYSNGPSTCDCCTQLLCADCLCECCGGDLISCC